METFWYIALAFMIIMYVVLDGFDLGAGIIHLSAAKNDNERRTIINSIGPLWDGNEVWLIAAGGTLFFAFPLLYASSFSGFYLPLIMVLWLLIGRALGIELRKHVDNPLWKSFWDAMFFLSSLLLVIIFGAALGNLVRGVPLDEHGFFFEPLWTTFTVVPNAGILDWFTVLMGIVALFTLTAHGSNFIAMKTENGLQQKARRYSSISNWGVLLTSIAALISVSVIRPEVWNNYSIHIWGYIFPITGLAGLAGMVYYRFKQNDYRAFLSSAMFIIGMLSATAFGLYPNVLSASTDPKNSLTIYNASTGQHGLQIGLIWWIIGIILAIGYFIYLFYIFRGKVKVTGESY
ncbi:MAG: cytochrome d ubiquinol oxidase subunit II [Ignavibacteriae bacterium]|nr:MAG: cytochrome d ubiquinol oxidase subunit II [Ignavibacteriota bacterium]